MIRPRTVVINGDLGSGKTTVSVMLAGRLGLRRVSIGDLYRRMAAAQGMTALQFNLRAELDDKVDRHIDQLQHDIAASAERLVVDSRLAWYFFTDAFKVHLIVDPVVAARRVLARPGDAVEHYGSAEQAGRQLAERSESERQRFLARYGVDKTDLRNYDLVCDTTRAKPEQVVTRIIDMLETPAALSAPECHLDPGRVRPVAATDDDGEIVVLHQAPHFVAVRGHGRLKAAMRAGETLTPMVLAGDH